MALAMICPMGLMQGSSRATYAELLERVAGFDFVLPRLLHDGPAFSVEAALEAIATSGHGALDSVEGAVWRVERNELINPGRGGDRGWRVDFLVKYVRPDKVDGSYLPGVNGNTMPLWNSQKGIAVGGGIAQTPN